jgi:acyl-CoA synthetase (AMP-forming)/AMP-acid ligase II
MTTPGRTVNVVTHLRDRAVEHPERLALVQGLPGQERSLTYGELWDQVGRIGSSLAQLGLQRGDRAIVMIPMSLELYAVLLGVLKIGAVAVFVDPWISVRRIAQFAAFAEPTAFLGVAKSHWLRLFEAKLRRLPITVTTGRRYFRIPARSTLTELLQGLHDSTIAATTADETALITFTSGSSGLPKGADRTHGLLLAQHEALQAEFPYQETDIDMPMFPIFALNNLAAGRTSVIPEIDFRNVRGVDGGQLLEQIRKHDVKTATASPPLFDRLAEAWPHVKSAIPVLRRILTGGAPVNDEQLRVWRKTWPETEIQVVYGSTEAEPVAHLTAEARAAVTAANNDPAPGYLIGTPTNSLRTRLIRIVKGPVQLDEQGWTAYDVARGEVGELIVSGAHVCRGYFRRDSKSDENKIHEPDGTVWHRMGDTAYADEAGRLWLVGRVHSTIDRAGRQHHAQRIERIARDCDAQLEQVAAVGIPDPALGERIVLVARPTIDEATFRARLAAADEMVDEILVTATPLPVDPRHNSKIDYPALRAKILSKTL